MLVKELIEELQKCDQEAEVLFVRRYIDDAWNFDQVEVVEGNIEACPGGKRSNGDHGYYIQLKHMTRHYAQPQDSFLTQKELAQRFVDNCKTFVVIR